MATDSTAIALGVMIPLMILVLIFVIVFFYLKHRRKQRRQFKEVSFRDNPVMTGKLPETPRNSDVKNSVFIYENELGACNLSSIEEQETSFIEDETSTLKDTDLKVDELVKDVLDNINEEDDGKSMNIVDIDAKLDEKGLTDMDVKLHNKAVTDRISKASSGNNSYISFNNEPKHNSGVGQEKVKDVADNYYESMVGNEYLNFSHKTDKEPSSISEDDKKSENESKIEKTKEDIASGPVYATVVKNTTQQYTEQEKRNSITDIEIPQDIDDKIPDTDLWSARSVDEKCDVTPRKEESETEMDSKDSDAQQVPVKPKRNTIKRVKEKDILENKNSGESNLTEQTERSESLLAEKEVIQTTDSTDNFKDTASYKSATEKDEVVIKNEEKQQAKSVQDTKTKGDNFDENNPNDSKSQPVLISTVVTTSNSDTLNNIENEHDKDERTRERENIDASNLNESQVSVDNETATRTIEDEDKSDCVKTNVTKDTAKVSENKTIEDTEEKSATKMIENTGTDLESERSILSSSSVTEDALENESKKSSPEKGATDEQFIPVSIMEDGDGKLEKASLNNENLCNKAGIEKTENNEDFDTKEKLNSNDFKTEYTKDFSEQLNKDRVTEIKHGTLEIEGKPIDGIDEEGGNIEQFANDEKNDSTNDKFEEKIDPAEEENVEQLTIENTKLIEEENQDETTIEKQNTKKEENAEQFASHRVSLTNDQYPGESLIEEKKLTKEEISDQFIGNEEDEIGDKSPASNNKEIDITKDENPEQSPTEEMDSTKNEKLKEDLTRDKKAEETEEETFSLTKVASSVIEEIHPKDETLEQLTEEKEIISSKDENSKLTENDEVDKIKDEFISTDDNTKDEDVDEDESGDEVTLSIDALVRKASKKMIFDSQADLKGPDISVHEIDDGKLTEL